MKIDDLLLVAGDNTLESFVWGPRLVDVVNFHGDGKNRLDETMTGVEARHIFRSMNMGVLLRLHEFDFDIQSGELRELTPPEPEPIVEPEPYVPEPAPVVVAPVAIDPNAGRNRIALTMAAIITGITIVLVLVISYISIKSGEMQDTTGVVGLAQAMAEVIKALIGS